LESVSRAMHSSASRALDISIVDIDRMTRGRECGARKQRSGRYGLEWMTRYPHSGYHNSRHHLPATWLPIRFHAFTKGQPGIPTVNVFTGLCQNASLGAAFSYFFRWFPTLIFPKLRNESANETYWSFGVC